MTITFLKRHVWKIVPSVILLGGIVAGVMYLTKSDSPEYVTEKVRYGDLVQIVDAVGIVTSEKNLELKFPVSGIVSDVFVKEGDQMKADDVLSRLRSGALSAAVEAARAQWESARADLRALEEGSRPEDISIKEAEVGNKRASLEAARSQFKTAEESLTRSRASLKALKKEAETSLAGYVQSAQSTSSKELTASERALRVIDDVVESTVTQDIIVKHAISQLGELRALQRQAQPIVSDARTLTDNVEDFEDALHVLTQSSTALTRVLRTVTYAYELIVSLPITSNFTVGVRETNKNTLADEKDTLESALSSLDDSLKNLRDASSSFLTKIATEEGKLTTAEGDRTQAEAAILTHETALQVADAELALKRAGARQSDIDAASARVRQELADLRKAQADLDDTILTAPIDGTITKVNLKRGEFTPGQFTATEPAITLLGSSPYRVEMYVAEIDIPKVTLSQEATITLDAFPDTPFGLRVSEIDPAASDVDGVSKYLVTLDFLDPPPRLKIGMTGDAEIETGLREHVLLIPARSVVEDEEGYDAIRILHDDGEIEFRRLEVGLEGVRDIEVLGGVKEGETVILLIREP